MAKLIETLAIAGSRKSDGYANASGKVWAYVPGTSAQAALYPDAEETAPLAQPVVLDAAGRATVFVDQAVTLHIETSAGVTVADVEVIDDAGVVGIANAGFTGTLPDGSQGAGGSTDLDAVLTSALTSFGGTNFRYAESTGATQRGVSSWMRDVWISAKDYGAVGDGAVDDTVACQTAINRVVARGGGVVYFPAGRYLLTAALTNTSSVAVSFEGAGAYSSVIQQTSTSANALSLGASLQIGWHIAHLNFSAAPGTTGAAISIAGGSAISIRDCYIIGHKTGVLFASGTTLDSTISGNLIDASNLANGNAISVVGTLSRSSIYGNTLFGSNAAVSFTAHAGTIQIYGNSINGTTSALALPSTAVTNPTLFFANMIYAGVITQAGSSAYFKQWDNGIDGVSTTVTATLITLTPDITKGRMYRINVTAAAPSALTLAAPSPVPTMRGIQLHLSLVNNSASTNSWTVDPKYHLETTVISGAPGASTEIVVEYDLERAVWVEVGRATVFV